MAMLVGEVSLPRTTWAVGSAMVFRSEVSSPMDADAAQQTKGPSGEPLGPLGTWCVYGVVKLVGVNVALPVSAQLAALLTNGKYAAKVV